MAALIDVSGPGFFPLPSGLEEKLGELKEQAMSAIKSFLIEKIVVAGVTWLISLLNPASAFVKACKMIYDVIMFFVERGEQIMGLVNAVIDSVEQIASAISRTSFKLSGWTITLASG